MRKTLSALSPRSRVLPKPLWQPEHKPLRKYAMLALDIGFAVTAHGTATKRVQHKQTECAKLRKVIKVRTL